MSPALKSPATPVSQRDASLFFQTAEVPVDALYLLTSSCAPHESLTDDAIHLWDCDCPDICPIWKEIRQHAETVAANEPLMASYLHATILNHRTLPKALTLHLATKLSDESFSSMALRDLFTEVFDHHDTNWAIRMAIKEDLIAIHTKDAACRHLMDAFLHYKGFVGLQCYRLAHCLWQQGRVDLARLLQARISTVFSMDIHPAATIGKGVIFDHASGVVIGETAVIGDGCTFLHNVTLGATGKVSGDRHPKLGRNVSVGAGVSIPARLVVPKVASESNLSLSMGQNFMMGRESIGGSSTISNQ